MATSIGNNTSLLFSPDYYIRREINEYVAKINFILAYIQFFISLIGILGNILALIVINRKSLRYTSSAVFITYMAIFDSAVLILHAANLGRPRRNLFIHCSLTYLTDLFTFCANWVLVIITLERCVAVSSPFLAKRFCTVYSARYSVYMLLTVALIIFSSTFPIIYQTDNTPNRKKCLIRPQYNLFHRLYQLIVFYGIPDILLLSNIFTIYILIRRRKHQEQQSIQNNKCDSRISDVNSNRKQRQLTIMLVTVNISFYIFTTPAMIIYILESSPPKHFEINRLKRSFVFSQITVPLLQLHNATNFIFYSLAGQRFRQVTLQIFHEYSIRFKNFYYQYILCDKNYTPLRISQLESIGPIKTNRCGSNTETVKKHSLRTSTI